MLWMRTADFWPWPRPLGLAWLKLASSSRLNQGVVLKRWRSQQSRIAASKSRLLIHPQIKVTGKVQTPWFGAGIGMNVAWRFLLNPDGKIYFVAIDLLASPAELLKFGR